MLILNDFDGSGTGFDVNTNFCSVPTVPDTKGSVSSESYSTIHCDFNFVGCRRGTHKNPISLLSK